MLLVERLFPTTCFYLCIIMDKVQINFSKFGMFLEDKQFIPAWFGSHMPFKKEFRMNQTLGMQKIQSLCCHPEDLYPQPRNGHQCQGFAISGPRYPFSLQM
jgi:hypothetical protein